MSGHPVEADNLISCLSHRPNCLLSAMVKIPNPPKRPNATCDNRHSSIGSLDRLPLELVYIVLGMLDVRSVTRVASVSIKGGALVKCHPAYRDMIDFAPEAMAALAKTDVIGLHSLTKLHATLRSERCICCREYGAFLFLPTCERCCWECLRFKPSLRLLPPKEAGKYFRLSQRHLQQLPIISTIPGCYGILATETLESYKLVSVKHARELGIAVHGSADRLAESFARRCKRHLTIVAGRYFQNESPVLLTQDSLLLPDPGNIPNDKFFGMASIPFPSLRPPDRVEHGLWCLGCQATLQQDDRSPLPQDILETLVPRGLCIGRVLLGMERRARSKTSFLSHVKHCYGATLLVPELAAEIE